MEREYYDPNERLEPLSRLAQYGGTTPDYLRYLIFKGKLKGEKIGNIWFSKKEWLDAYRATLSRASAGETAEIPDKNAPVVGAPSPDAAALAQTQFIPLADIAKEYGVSHNYLRFLIFKKKLRAEKFGRNWVTARAWMDEFFSAPAQAGAAPRAEPQAVREPAGIAAEPSEPATPPPPVPALSHAQLENVKNNFILGLASVALLTKAQTQQLLANESASFGGYTVAFAQITQFMSREADRAIAIKEYVNMHMRALVREAFQVVDIYLSKTGRHRMADREPWYRFGKQILTAINGDFLIRCPTKRDEVTWRDRAIARDMHGEPLRLDFFGYAEAWTLFQDLVTWLAAQTEQ